MTKNNKNEIGENQNSREGVGDRVTIFKTPKSPNWYIDFSDGRTQFRKSLRTKSKKRAITLAKKKDAELTLGLTSKPGRGEITISDASERYLISRELIGRDKGTLEIYRRDLAQFTAYAKWRGVVRLTQADDQLLEDYHSRLQTEGMKGIIRQPKLGRRVGPNSPKTIRNKLKTVRQLLKWALGRKLLWEDPASGYQLPPEPEGKAYCWTPQEHELLRRSAELPWLEIFDFLTMTGLRADEFCWLLKEDLCLEGRPHLLIRAKTCPQTNKAWHPKHRRERVVPLCPNAAKIARRAYSTSLGPWLFWSPNSRGRQRGHYPRDAIWRALRRTLDKAGIQRGTVHTFRHLFCSVAANNNVAPFKVMSILGHGSLEIVLRYYHIGEDELLKSLDGLPFGQMQAGRAEGG